MAFIYDLSDTWNNAGISFSGIKINVTDSASAAGSKLLDLQIGSASKFTVGKTGTVTATGLIESTVGGFKFPDGTTQITRAVTSVTSTDGSVAITGTTSVDLSAVFATSASNLLLPVRNTTGATLTKGTAVYISGATGQLSTVSKAIATGDATSAQTLGLVTANIANNANGNVTLIGTITNIDTSAYTDGQQLYLSPTTAGTLTATKPYAPQHLVYMAVVEHAHPTQGKLFVKVQNGYELDELHNVSAQTPSNNHGIFYNTATSLWENKSIVTALGYTPYNATNPAGYTTNVGTVTSVSGTGTVNGLTLTGSVTTSGSLTLGGTLGNIANSQLTNSAITINGTSTALGGSISVGTVTSVAALTLGTSGTDLASSVANGTTTPVITLNVPTASATNRGALSSSDWSTFNAKQAALVSGTNIKTVGGASLLGSGDVGTIGLAYGGTGATTASGARTALGLGTAAVLNAGVSGGVATLDGSGTVPTSQLPGAVLGGLNYQGTWNASTNTPTLASSTGSKGYYYVVSVAGSTNLNGITDWKIGDWAVYDGTTWQKVDNTDAVSSVNGYTGAVVLTTSDVAQGTNLYFTQAAARGSVSAGTGISYDSGTGVITNSAPDQTVALTGAGTTVVTGTYPNFTITSNDSTVGTVTSVAASGGTTGLSFTGSPITTSGTLTLGGTLGVVNGGTGATSLSSGYLLKGNGTSAVSASVIYDTGTNVGIGTATPSATLDINGNMVLPNSGIINFKDAGGVNRNVLQFISGEVRLGGAGAGLSTQTFYTSAAERMRVTANGDVLVNTTTSLYGYANNPSIELNGVDGSTIGLKKGNVAGSYISYSTNLNIFNTTANGIVLATNNTERMRITSAGDVGIGTSAPASTLNVRTASGAAPVNTFGANAVRLTSTTTAAVGVGPSILFEGQTGNTTASYGFAAIQGFKSSATLNDYSGTLAFFTQNNGGSTALTERMRIDGTGQVGIGVTPMATGANGNLLQIGNPTTNAGSGLTIGSTTTADIQFSDATTGAGQYAGLIRYSHTSDNMGFWTASTVRMSIDASGNVGIGTASPATLLHISATNPEFRLQGTNGTGNIHKIRSTGVNSEALQITSAGDVYYNANAQVFRAANESTEYMRITSAGNVGIGTSSPNSKLQIVGSGPVASIAHDNTGSGGFTGVLRFAATNGLNYIQSGLSYSVGSAAPLIFGSISAANEWMRITDTGNVGIGVTSPAARLHVVNSTVNAQFRLQDVTTDATNKYGVVGTGHYTNAQSPILAVGVGSLSASNTVYIGGGFGSLNAATAIQFFTAANNTTLTGTERMRIDASGNVGIGTSPTAKLHVAGTIQSSSGSSTAQMFSDGTAAYFTSVGAFPAIFSVNGAERMRINASGNVGIGTTNPSPYSGYVTLAVGGSTGGSLDFVSSAVGVNYNRVGQISAATGGAMSFATGAGDALAERMRISAAGNVGIGTSAPAYPLDVTGQGRATTGWAVSTDGSAFTPSGLNAIPNYGTGFITSTSVTTLAGFGGISAYTNQLERMRIDGSGNVGIGTSAPSVKLDVVGNVLAREDNSAGATPVLLRNSNTGNNTTKSSSALFQGTDTVGTVKNIGSIGFFPDDANYISANLRFLVRSGDATPTERMRIISAGYVGIGTSAPSSILHAVASGSELRSENTSTVQYFSGRVRVKGPAGTYRSTAMVHGNGNTGGTNTYFAIEGADSADNYLQTLALYDYAGQFWGFSTNATERMRIDSSGNLLVGTTTSFGKLSVFGTAGFNADANSTIPGSGSYKFRGAAAGTTITTYDYLNYTAMQFIRDNGNPTNTVGSITCTDGSTSYNTSSDRRLKKDVIPAPDAGAIIDSINIVSHGWKSNDTIVPFGVIAQDLHAVAPQAVHVGDDADEIESVWGVDYSKLVPMLVKELQSLRARVAQLEGN